ncbi:hypothetical protein Tco_0772646 [Tanacetum coccineum]|uniref:Reverse transcriptase domain-containing protein n=1 Tax=Tanacetum coccineum TaxID=301880 RepID=A0ABQ4ZLY1_9ASTR
MEEIEMEEMKMEEIEMVMGTEEEMAITLEDLCLKDYPKLRNQNHRNKTGSKNGNKTGNQTGSNEATAKAYAIRGGEANPDSNIVTVSNTKGIQVYLAQVTSKKTEDKSKEKRLKDVLIVREFPKVFPEDFPGLPPARQVEFQIDLVPGVAPVARAPYRLAPAKIQELSTHCKNFLTKDYNKDTVPTP